MKTWVTLYSGDGCAELRLSESNTSTFVELKASAFANSGGLLARSLVEVDFTIFLKTILEFLESVEVDILDKQYATATFEASDRFNIHSSPPGTLILGPGKACFDLVIEAEPTFSTRTRLVVDVTVIDNFKEEVGDRLYPN